jgi:hypothetical protein
MGLALDKPKADDERMEVEGFSFIMGSEVADAIRSYGELSIDYADYPWAKGFKLSFSGNGSC